MPSDGVRRNKLHTVRSCDQETGSDGSSRHGNLRSVPRLLQVVAAVATLWIPFVAFFGPSCVPGYARRADVLTAVAIAAVCAGLLVRGVVHDDDRSRVSGILGAAGATSLFVAIVPSLVPLADLALLASLRPPVNGALNRKMRLALVIAVVGVRVALVLAMATVPVDLLVCQTIRYASP